ncbi:hypothetical protein THUN1379_20060 [Paludibacterium sp. THUN1379]|nr:hypothetical protein THUN1379_20060 [Paludibacterium sp. THUN1379]
MPIDWPVAKRPQQITSSYDLAQMNDDYVKLTWADSEQKRQIATLPYANLRPETTFSRRTGAF